MSLEIFLLILLDIGIGLAITLANHVKKISSHEFKTSRRVINTGNCQECCEFPQRSVDRTIVLHQY